MTYESCPFYADPAGRSTTEHRLAHHIKQTFVQTVHSHELPPPPLLIPTASSFRASPDTFISIAATVCVIDPCHDVDWVQDYCQHISMQGRLSTG